MTIKVEKLEVKRVCIECFDEDYVHELHTGEYVLSFTAMDRTETIHLCQRHTEKLFAMLKVVLWIPGDKT